MKCLLPWDTGVSGMFETCMVAVLVAAMCALIRENGGFDVLLDVIHRVFKGSKSGQLGVGILVALLDVATANNTVAIVMANPIAKEMADDYQITPRKTASLLDTFSCISQGVIPYGAQMLVAISAVHELGGEISAFQIIPKLLSGNAVFQFADLYLCDSTENRKIKQSSLWIFILLQIKGLKPDEKYGIIVFNRFWNEKWYKNHRYIEGNDKDEPENRSN